MKKLLLALLCFISPLTLFAAAPSANWPLIWFDEFTGTTLDGSKWSSGSLPWGGQHHNDEYASWITSEDSYLQNGSLILRSRKATGSEFGGYPYSEGFVHSNGKMNYTYGLAEIRARFPVGKGVWPAFWSLSYGWPPEFDIAEYFGSDNRMHMGMAYGVCCPASWDSSNFYENFTDWHTYSLEWGPGYAVWRKDGISYKGVYHDVTTQPMYLILNSGMRWDADATTPFPNYFEVDYVRLYSPPVTSINDNTLGAGLNQFNYVGTWGYASANGSFQNDNHWSSVTNNYYQVQFSGTQVDLFGAVAPNHGIAAVSIDGGAEALVDFYAPTRRDQLVVWSSPALASGTHTIRVRPTGNKNVSSTGASVTADRVDVWNVSTALPVAPTSLSSTAGNAVVNLTWTQSSSAGITANNVYRSTASSGPYGLLATLSPATAYSDNTAQNGTTYYYAVTAVNGNGESGYSNFTAATPQAPPPPPSAPTGLTAASPRKKTINLTWTASTGATTYTVKRATTNGGPYANVATGVTTTSYSNGGLTSGTTYYYVVTASNTAGESTPSNQASATAK